MKYISEPELLPRETPPPPLYCSLCFRSVSEALELQERTICHACLQAQDMHHLSALLCAPIVTQEPVYDQGGTL